MSVGRRCRFLMLLLPLFVTGCGPLFGLPTVWPPESEKTQVARASKFDPFPDPNMGPAVIGGRPQGFLNPRPEPDPNKTVRSDWFNPAPGAGYPPAVYYPGAAAAYPPPPTTIYTYPSTVAVAPTPGVSSAPPPVVYSSPVPPPMAPAVTSIPPAAATAAPIAYGKKIDSP